MTDYSANLESVNNQVAEALARSGRGPRDAELLVVSKTWPVEVVREVVDAGHTLFGESRVQEAVVKVPALPSHLDWHFIGHLQKNKIRKILPLVSTLHSIDSLELARQVDRVAGELGVFPQAYLEVNVAGDAAKFGFSPEQIREEIEPLLALERVEVVGLMTIPPFTPEAEDARPHFAALRELRDALVSRTGTPLPGLSMGMSHDFTTAIEEGSTIVRVGTGIFGKRKTARKPPADPG